MSGDKHIHVFEADPKHQWLKRIVVIDHINSVTDRINPIIQIVTQATSEAIKKLKYTGLEPVYQKGGEGAVFKFTYDESTKHFLNSRVFPDSVMRRVFALLEPNGRPLPSYLGLE